MSGGFRVLNLNLFGNLLGVHEIESIGELDSRDCPCSSGRVGRDTVLSVSRWPGEEEICKRTRTPA